MATATQQQISKTARETAGDVDRAHAQLVANGPMHIGGKGHDPRKQGRSICSALRIPGKSGRARRLYDAIKAESEQKDGRFQRAPSRASFWMARGVEVRPEAAE